MCVCVCVCVREREREREREKIILIYRHHGTPGPRDELTCSAIVGDKFNISTNQSASWSYDRCPDVEECRLGLHDCHLNATCQNTFDGYECHCNQGFVGDGRDHCEKT